MALAIEITSIVLAIWIGMRSIPILLMGNGRKPFGALALGFAFVDLLIVLSILTDDTSPTLWRQFARLCVLFWVIFCVEWAASGQWKPWRWHIPAMLNLDKITRRDRD